MQRGKQLTVRGVPEPVAESLKLRAREQGKSLNAVLVEALTAAAGMSGESLRHHDLDWLAGTWDEDPDFDAAIAAQDAIDDELTCPNCRGSKGLSGNNSCIRGADPSPVAALRFPYILPICAVRRALPQGRLSARNATLNP